MIIKNIHEKIRNGMGRIGGETREGRAKREREREGARDREGEMEWRREVGEACVREREAVRWLSPARQSACYPQP